LSGWQHQERRIASVGCTKKHHLALGALMANGAEVVENDAPG